MESQGDWVYYFVVNLHERYIRWVDSIDTALDIVYNDAEFEIVEIQAANLDEAFCGMEAFLDEALEPLCADR